MRDKYFEIEAESIVVSSRDSAISNIVLFRPSDDTMKRLRELKQGDAMGALRLLDKYDDGSEDIHINNRPANFIMLSGSGDGRKTHTHTLLVCHAF